MDEVAERFSVCPRLLGKVLDGVRYELQSYLKRQDVIGDDGLLRSLNRPNSDVNLGVLLDHAKDRLSAEAFVFLQSACTELGFSSDAIQEALEPRMVQRPCHGSGDDAAGPRVSETHVSETSVDRALNYNNSRLDEAKKHRMEKEALYEALTTQRRDILKSASSVYTPQRQPTPVPFTRRNRSKSPSLSHCEEPQNGRKNTTPSDSSRTSSVSPSSRMSRTTQSPQRNRKKEQSVNASEERLLKEACTLQSGIGLNRCSSAPLIKAADCRKNTTPSDSSRTPSASPPRRNPKKKQSVISLEERLPKEACTLHSGIDFNKSSRVRLIVAADSNHDERKNTDSAEQKRVELQMSLLKEFAQKGSISDPCVRQGRFRLSLGSKLKNATPAQNKPKSPQRSVNNGAEASVENVCSKSVAEIKTNEACPVELSKVQRERAMIAKRYELSQLRKALEAHLTHLKEGAHGLLGKDNVRDLILSSTQQLEKIKEMDKELCSLLYVELEKQKEEEDSQREEQAMKKVDACLQIKRSANTQQFADVERQLLERINQNSSRSMSDMTNNSCGVSSEASELQSNESNWKDCLRDSVVTHLQGLYTKRSIALVETSQYGSASSSFLR